jgi:hypothetical protein
MSITILFALAVPINSLWAWAPQVQSNYLKEAIRILPWFQFSMCKDYKNHLVEGIVEAEYQFWFSPNAKCKGLASKLRENKLKFVKGWGFQEKDIGTIVKYFHEKLEGLKSSIRKGDKPYAKIMFELGYYLHPINNYLKPPYFHTDNPTKDEMSYHNKCFLLAKDTKTIELNTNNIDTIKELKPWLKMMLIENLKARDEWYQAAKTDKSSFAKYTRLASERNIYNLASIINYVLSDLAPMTPELKKFVYGKINRMFKGGRKPGI